MVLAAGLGTRLRPLTYEITKPMVPVLDRPVMEHILDLLDRHSFGPVIANLHYFPDTIREHFGERLEYRYEPELLGTAGGVRGCADFFGDEPFLVISGDALTDVDLGALEARHHETDGIATLSVKQVPDTREFGVVLHDRDGRITFMNSVAEQLTGWSLADATAAGQDRPDRAVVCGIGDIPQPDCVVSIAAG